MELFLIPEKTHPHADCSARWITPLVKAYSKCTKLHSLIKLFWWLQPAPGSTGLLENILIFQLVRKFSARETDNFVSVTIWTSHWALREMNSVHNVFLRSVCRPPTYVCMLQLVSSLKFSVQNVTLSLLPHVRCVAFTRFSRCSWWRPGMPSLKVFIIQFPQLPITSILQPKFASHFQSVGTPLSCQ
jgi:hypothetical protein